MKKLLVVLSLMVLSCGCATTTETGMLIGGLTGAAIGAGTGAGAVVGGVIGGATGGIIGHKIGTSDADTVITVNIPCSDGSIQPVRLKRRGGVWHGPQGEMYQAAPTVEQLKPRYGR